VELPELLLELPLELVELPATPLLELLLEVELPELLVELLLEVELPELLVELPLELLELLALELLDDCELSSLPPPQALSATNPAHRTAYAGIFFSMLVIPGW